VEKTDLKAEAIAANQIAVSLIKKDKYSSIENVIKYLDKAIKMNPNYDLAYSNRACAYFKKRKYRLALEDCNQAIRINPFNTKAFLVRGNCYCLIGNYERARYDYGKACELGAYSFIHLIKILKRKGIS